MLHTENAEKGDEFILPFFSSSCYKDFSDDETGFYTVYHAAFKEVFFVVLPLLLIAFKYIYICLSIVSFLLRFPVVSLRKPPSGLNSAPASSLCAQLRHSTRRGSIWASVCFLLAVNFSCNVMLSLSIRVSRCYFITLLAVWLGFILIWIQF